MMCVAAAGSSFNGAFDIDGCSFSYSYSADEARGYLNIKIYPADFDTIHNQGIILKTDAVGKNGVFSGRIVIPPSFAEGRYIAEAAVGGERKRKIIIKADASRLSELANAAGKNNAGFVETLLRENNSYFDCNNEIIDAIGKDIAGYICKNRSETPDGEEFLALRMQGEAFGLVSAGQESLNNVCDRYEVFMQELDFSVYADFSDKEKQCTDNIFKGADVTGVKIQAFLDDVFLTARAAASGDGGSLGEILLGNAAYGLDLGEYNRLGNSYYRANVFTELAGGAGKWKSVNDIQKDFNAAVKKQQLRESQDSGKASSNSGKPPANTDYTGGTAVKAVLSDIEGHWAETAITDLYKREVVSGYEDNTFMPEKTITRAEFTAMVVKLFEAEPKQAVRFNDVREGDWFYSQVMLAAGNGWVKGTSDSEFSPHELITREDAAVILYRAVGKAFADAESLDFADSEEISEYAWSAVAVMCENNIINGYDGYFYPKRAITRAETAMLLYSAAGKNMQGISTAEHTGSARLYYAEQLLSYIDRLPERSGRGVTGIEFVKKVCDLFGIYKLDSKEGGFSDAAVDSEGADAVYTALANGWIESSAQFEPNRNITAAQAVRIIVNAAGYGIYVQGYGGDINAYVRTASRYNFDDGAQINNLDGELSWESAVVLMYNALNLYCTPGQDELKSDDTWLETLYGIFRTSGIVNRTHANSLDSTDEVIDDMLIELNGVRFTYADSSAELLGRSYTAFYSEKNGEKTVLLLVPEQIGESVIDIRDFRKIENQRLEYEEASGRRRTLRLDRGVIMLYNGRAVRYDEKFLSAADGELRLLDNDNDGEYELVFISGYRYAKAESVEPYGFTAGFADGGRYIDITEENVIFNVADADGGALTPYDIKKGDVLEMLISDDEMLISIKILRDTVSGTLKYIDAEEGILGVDDKEYTMSKQLFESSYKMLAVGDSVTVYLASSGRAAHISAAESDFMYGYLIKTLIGEDDGDIRFKIINTGGRIETLEAADKATVDSAGMARTELWQYMQDAKEPQLVRYITEGGRLVKLDFAEASSGEDMFGYRNSNDSLTEYDFGVDTFLYRSAPDSCMPYFNLSETVIFKVPKDISQSEYAVVGKSGNLLTDNVSYKLKIYDIGENGSPKAAVLEYEPFKEKANWKDKSYIVEKVKTSVNLDNEPVREILCWSGGEYYSLYLPYTVDVLKDNGAELCGGDIFRAKLMNDGQTILSICVDVYYRDGKCIGNISDDAVFNGGNVNITYQIGKMYKISGKYGYIATETDVFGDYLYTLKEMKNVNVNTKNIAVYDTQNGKVRPAGLDEIKTYSAYKDDCGFAVIRQSRFAPECIFIYE